ncbi:MAG: hypothetical protein HC857_16130 [Synechococcales cyanobacterium RU_4_20]|nr:hypothetical protein [Synechococcales cyanobacterium RU_4_20]NJR71603.1 hypothetical protein [Synechococcales cyanobacterium CRU_2_2]
MPSKDVIHDPVKRSIQTAGWQITDDPYVISYGERFLFIDLGAQGHFIGAERDNQRIAIEIKALDLPLNLLVINIEQCEIKQWIPKPSELPSSKS